MTKNRVFRIRLPKRMVRSMDQLAKKKGMTRNELIIKAIEYWVTNVVESLKIMRGGVWRES